MKDRLLNVAVIGTGNCGGQMADLASGEGFDAIAINASSDDLELLVNKVECFLVGDGNGTGKNRDNAKAYLSDHSNIFEDQRIIRFITGHDVIVIATSTGGGFGSGSSLELVKKLSEKHGDKLFIPAGVMPFNSEGYTAQLHGIEWEQELEDMQVPYILYDNDRFSGKPEQEVCRAVNMNFIRDLRIMRGDFVYDSKIGGIDARDMLTTLSTPGRLVMGSLVNIDEEDIVDRSLISTVKKYIDEESAHADVVDDKQIMASAIMYCLPEEFDLYKGTIRSDLQNTYGEHISDYTNFTDITDDNLPDATPCIAIVLAGLTTCQTRIGKMVKRHDKLAQGILGRKAPESKVSKVDKSVSSKLKLGAKSFGGTPTTPNKVDTEQALSKFAGGSTPKSESSKKTEN